MPSDKIAGALPEFPRDPLPIVPRLLISYAYARKQDTFDQLFTATAASVEWLCDCGAFTDFFAARKAAAKGKPYARIVVQDYIAWLASHADFFWQYIALDEIRDVAASRRNLAAMQGAGLNPMPVFVYPEDYDLIPDLVAANPYVCVAGGVDAQRKFLWQRYNRVYAASEGRARIHALGFVKYPDMYQLPLASVDSSSWHMGMHYGQISRYEARRGKLAARVSWHSALGVAEKKRDRHLASMTRPKNAAAVAYMRSCGMTPDAARNPDTWKGSGGMPSLSTTFSHLQYSFGSASRGLRHFLAIAHADQIVHIAVVHAATTDDRNAFDFPLARAALAELNRMKKGTGRAEMYRTAAALLAAPSRAALAAVANQAPSDLPTSSSITLSRLESPSRIRAGVTAL